MLYYYTFKLHDMHAYGYNQQSHKWTDQITHSVLCKSDSKWSERKKHSHGAASPDVILVLNQGKINVERLESRQLA